MSVLWALIKRVTHDVVTTSNGDYDPARLFGYGFALAACLVFLANAITDLIINHRWDPVQYSLGAVAMGGMFTAVAAGVRIKADTENPATPAQQQPHGPLTGSGG